MLNKDFLNVYQKHSKTFNTIFEQFIHDSHFQEALLLLGSAINNTPCELSKQNVFIRLYDYCAILNELSEAMLECNKKDNL